jgi:hypothetical protein
MKKTIFVLLTVLALGFLVISCGSDDGGSGDNPFVGTWTGTFGSGDSMKLVCTSKTWTTAGSDFGTYKGEYTYEGNAASFYVSGVGVGNATVTGNTMTGNIQGSGFTVTK